MIWTFHRLATSVDTVSRHPPFEVRFWSRVDLSDIDGCWLWTGAKQSAQGYGSFILNGKLVYPHRVAYKIFIGPVDGLQLDHICRNKLCLQPKHLRPVNHKQNGENRGIDRNNTSGARGVSWNKQRQRWIASVRHYGITHYLGAFREFEDAKAAAIAKRNELYTHNELDRLEGSVVK